MNGFFCKAISEVLEKKRNKDIVKGVCCSSDVLAVLCVFTEEELRKLREETNVEVLKQELDKERGKRLDLEQRMTEVLKTR